MWYISLRIENLGDLPRLTEDLGDKKKVHMSCDTKHGVKSALRSNTSEHSTRVTMWTLPLVVRETLTGDGFSASSRR